MICDDNMRDLRLSSMYLVSQRLFDNTPCVVKQCPTPSLQEHVHSTSAVPEHPRQTTQTQGNRMQLGWDKSCIPFCSDQDHGQVFVDVRPESS